MHQIYRILFLCSMSLLFSCSTTTNSTLATVRQVAFGNDDVIMSAEQVKKLPYASAYIKIDGNPQAFVVLAYADEDDRLSWVSANNTVFITKHGRIIKTVGLENDLSLISSAAQDPLTELRSKSNYRWQFQAEWAMDYVSGYRMLSRLNHIGKSNNSIIDASYETELFEEDISVEHSGDSWKNYYWVDPETSLVVKSKQRIGPNLPVIEMTILKPYAS